MPPKARVYGAWVLLALCAVGWPLSLVTFAQNEPPFVLSLSWLALILTAVDILSTNDVRKQQEGE